MIVASGRVTAFAWPRQWLMRPTADDRARPRSCGDPAKPSRWQAWFNVRIAYGADSTPRTGLQNITFPSHADNFRHALLFHRAGPAPMISRPQRLRQTAADLEDKALQCEGNHCDDEQRSNGSPAPAVLTGGIGNIATPCSVGAKWGFYLADFACDKKQDAFWSKQPSRGRSNTKVRWIELAASSH